MTPFLNSMAPTQRRSTSCGRTGRPPRTMPALAAKSLMVSKTLRGAWVSRSICSLRASMISIAGLAKSEAESRSNSVTPGPLSGLPRMKANSTSMRGAMKRLTGMSPPLVKNMSSISGAKSGSSIWLDCCIAREVRPILRPLTTRASASSRASVAMVRAARVVLIRRCRDRAGCPVPSPAWAGLASRCGLTPVANDDAADRVAVQQQCGGRFHVMSSANRRFRADATGVDAWIRVSRTRDAGCPAWHRRPRGLRPRCSVKPNGRAASSGARSSRTTADKASPMAWCTAGLRPHAMRTLK